MKVLTDAAGGGSYAYITSDTFPPLLDLMGRTVSAYTWASPQQANDASIALYTKKADGTTQTLTSITTNPAGEFTLLKLEDQTLNDDLVEVQVRFPITSNSKYVFFDHSRVMSGEYLYEYLLPLDLVAGDIDNVYIQSSNYSDFPCDDLSPKTWEKVYGVGRISDGTDTYLRLPSSYPIGRLIRLQGRKPLSTVSAFTDTIEIDGSAVNLFIAYAKYKLFQAVKTPVSSQDIDRYRQELAEAYGEYQRLLPTLRMHTVSRAMNIPEI